MKNNAVKNGKILNMALYSTAESKRNRLLFNANKWGNRMNEKVKKDSQSQKEK